MLEATVVSWNERARERVIELYLLIACMYMPMGWIGWMYVIWCVWWRVQWVLMPRCLVASLRLLLFLSLKKTHRFCPIHFDFFSYNKFRSNGPPIHQSFMRAVLRCYSLLLFSSFSFCRFNICAKNKWRHICTEWRHFICGTYIHLPADSSGKEWPKAPDHIRIWYKHHIIAFELLVWSLRFNTFNKIIVINKNGCNNGNNIIVIMRHTANTIEYINSKASFDYKRRVKYAQANILQYSHPLYTIMPFIAHIDTRARIHFYPECNANPYPS